MKFVQIESDKVKGLPLFKKDQKLYRYLTQAKFLDLVLRKEISFTPLKYFEDPLEGYTERDLYNLLHFTPNQTGDNDIDERLQIIADGKVNSAITIGNLYKNLCQASCWNYGHFESILMWKTYCPQGNGVLIEIDAKIALEHFKSTIESITDQPGFNGYVYYGCTEYKNVLQKGYKPPKPDEYFGKTKPLIGFVKDKAYRSEKEFRMLIEKNYDYLYKDSSCSLYDDSIVFSIDMTAILKKCTLRASPYMSDREIESLKKLSEEKLGLQVEKSEIRLGDFTPRQRRASESFMNQ